MTQEELFAAALGLHKQMLKGRSSEAPENLLLPCAHTVGYPEQIEAIAMGMSAVYVNRAGELFPGANIVFVQFHVTLRVGRSSNHDHSRPLDGNSGLPQYGPDFRRHSKPTRSSNWPSVRLAVAVTSSTFARSLPRKRANWIIIFPRSAQLKYPCEAANSQTRPFQNQ